MFNIGIIGCGKIAQVRHIPEYADNPNVKLSGYFDLNQERAAELAKKYGGKAYATYQDLLADKSIDAVSVCTANTSHAEITIAALKAGKHVLCEKPMATNLPECETMVKTAKETGKFLMIGHNQRLAKAHVKAKELLNSGLIGEIISFRTTFGHPGPETWSVDPGKSTWFFDKNRAAMGAMADLGIHKTDLIHFLTGQTIIETSAKLSTIDKRDATGALIGVDDNAICLYKLSGGATGTMTVSWTYYGAEDNSTVLYGTQGIMRIYDDPTYAIKVFTREGETILFDIDKIQTNDKQTKSGVIDLFVDSLVNNREPEISAAEVLKSMRVVFASIESSETGRSVAVNQA
ncbi:MAG: Gfo/Idh/MocA family oxidoreductase [Anaerolineaceae bacterium]|nr:Gfo/Idh/MocA family oxidoreductase [Anaerolineaceae bacterium]